MTFITSTFKQCTEQELEILKTRPPTDESRAFAAKIGRMMGERAYPGDMVVPSIEYEAGRLGWPGEITAIIGKLAYDGLQQR